MTYSEGQCVNILMDAINEVLKDVVAIYYAYITKDLVELSIGIFVCRIDY